MTKWFDAYNTITRALFTFYLKHRDKAGHEFFRRCSRDPEFRELNEWFAKFSKVYNTRSIDPINIFSSFNERNQHPIYRVERINSILFILGSKRKFGEIDFSGCPSPFSIRLKSARDERSQYEIWEVFANVVRRKQNGIGDKDFEQAKRWYGIDTVSFTIFLFWIAPKEFIPLDKNTVKLLIDSGIIKSIPRQFPEYSYLLRRRNTSFYIELAKKAFDALRDEKMRTEVVREVRRFFRKSKSFNSGGFEFKIVAIRPLSKLSKKRLKNLATGKIYQFYNDFEFLPDGKVKHENKFNLYSSNNIAVNISAVVGKNGSGKSTLSELIFLAINNLAFICMHPVDESDILFEKGVYLELYFQQQTLCKLIFQGSNISIVDYELRDGNYIEGEVRDITQYDISDFFYSIAVNFSHFSLNSKELGIWIEKLFHKNDGYQTPLVINPMRVDGNFDINRENQLVLSRLLANVLAPVKKGEKNSLRRLTDNDKYVTHISLSVDNSKIKHLNEFDDGHVEAIFTGFKRYFRISTNGIDPKLVKMTAKYIVGKLYRICRTYLPYKVFLPAESEFIPEEMLIDLFTKLNADKSHITYKIRQAMNFLKYRLYLRLKHNSPISIDILSEKIDALRSKYARFESFRIIELIPPSFLQVKLILNKKIPFNSLSSGEKQKIYTVSSIVYHLDNLNSVSPDNNLETYSFVNVILDEIELYFHPDMQRSFISYLLDYLKKTEFDNILALNFCFITHSPFILSDIPTNNILFLDDDGIPKNHMESIKTFGGNIHDLLHDSFFLNRFMGEFAKDAIDSAVSFLRDELANPNSNVPGEIWNESNLAEFIDCIGEPIIRDSLREMYQEKYFNSIPEIEKQIQKLQIRKQEMYDRNHNGNG